MRGRSLPLSIPRRIVTDILRLAKTVPSVPVERAMDLSPLIAARNACSPRPPWPTILAKAGAITMQQVPEGRRAFLKFPWPHLYEYPTSVAAIAVDRIFEGEPCVLIKLIKDPAVFSLSEITSILRHAKQAPLNEIRDFQRVLKIARLPGILRRPIWWLGFNIGRQRANYFGTFGVTDIAIGGLEFMASPGADNAPFDSWRIQTRRPGCYKNGRRSPCSRRLGSLSIHEADRACVERSNYGRVARSQQ